MNLTNCSILFLLYIVIITINKFNLYHLESKSEKFYQKKQNYKKVQDIFHNVLPHLDYLEYAPDFVFVVLIAYLLIMNYELIYQVAGFSLVIIFLRQFIIQLTVLPKNEVCEIKDTSTFRGGCYDKIFSGHFGITFLTTLILFDNGLINQLFMILINFVNALFILLARCHYTIDIVVSIFVVIIIYQNNLNICNYLDNHF
jgi:hypothetical protein